MRQQIFALQQDRQLRNKEGKDAVAALVASSESMAARLAVAERALCSTTREYLAGGLCRLG